MTQDDITKLAKAAGFLVDGDSWIHAGAVLVDGRKSIDEQLKRFAALVALAESEECAKVCEEIMQEHNPFDRQAGVARRCLDDIRARGEQT